MNVIDFDGEKDTSNVRITASLYGLKSGDIVTISGYYQRRTFWQWITRKPKQLKRYVIGEM